MVYVTARDTFVKAMDERIRQLKRPRQRRESMAGLETFEAQQHRLIGEILASPDWSAAEKVVVKWQLRLYGDFYTALWRAIIQADDEHLARLARGFPDEVTGLRLWREHDLAKRLRAAGLEI